MAPTGNTCYLLFAILLAALCSPRPASAQRGQDAGLAGTLRDSSGAVLAGGTVALSSPQLIGGSQTTTADGRGAYRLPFLPPGQYDIVAEHPGFKSARRQGVALLPGLTLTIDFDLAVAAVAETVLVDRPAPIVDIQTSAASILIDRKLLEDLPLSRTASDSVNLVPGVVQNVAFGGSQRSNPFSMDGTNGNEPGWGTPATYPNLNWIEEVQVVSLGADAQYGEFTGALVNAITRSGSNRFSGLADLWTTRPGWTGNNRGSLTPQLQENFKPVEILQRWDSDFQIAGPILKDRLWFFSGGEAYRNANRPASFSGVPKRPDEPKVAATERKFLTKLTSALSPAIRAEGYYEHDTQDITGANAGPLVGSESLAIATRPESMWNARLQWTLSARAFLEVRHGGNSFSSYSGPPADRRSGPPGHFDTLSGVTSGNTIFISDWQSRTMTTGAQFTYFAPGHSGRSHELRTGFEYEQARLRTFDGFVGGRAFWDYDGQPDLVELWDGATYRPTHGRNTFYAQDAWRAAERLTLNLGLRAGLYRGSVPGHHGAFSAHALSPRIGGAWDVAGDHRTVLRVHYGRYHDEMVTSFYDFLDPLSQTPDILATVVGPNQFIDPFVFPTATRANIDPGIKYPFMRELFVGAERQLRGGMSAKAHYISHDFKDSIGFIDPARSWLPVQRTDPGPDGRLGTADDGGPLTVFNDQDSSLAAPQLTNPKGAYRRYHGVQVILGNHHARTTEFQASYTWSRTVGSYNNAFSSNAANGDLGINGVFVNPNRALNAEGRTPQDFTHAAKILATYRLPWWGGVKFGGVYRYESGRPWARTAGGFGRTGLNAILVEPRGTRQLPAVNTLDLRIEKSWTMSPRIGTLGLLVDLFNIGNQGVPLSNTPLSGPNFGVPSQWIQPRTLRAGIRFIF